MKGCAKHRVTHTHNNYQLREPIKIRTHRWNLSHYSEPWKQHCRERGSKHEAGSEPKPVQKKEPSTGSTRGNPGERKTGPSTPRQEPPTGRQAREERVRPKAHKDYQPNGKKKPGRQRQAHNVSLPKGTKAREAGDRPKAHNADQPSKMKPKRGSEKGPRYTMPITRMARSQLTRARSPAETLARPG